MYKAVWNFWRRPPGEQLLAMEAGYCLAVAKLLLKRRAFNELALRYGLEQREEEDHPGGSDAEYVKKIGWAVDRMARTVPWESLCLDRALAAQRMLSRRGMKGLLYLGVAKDEKKKEGLKAHAWVCCGDQFVTGRAGHEAFTVVSCFGWS